MGFELINRLLSQACEYECVVVTLVTVDWPF